MAHIIPHTRKYIPKPALYSRVIAPAAAAVMPFDASSAGAKLAARPKEGCTDTPYEIQKPPECIFKHKPFQD